MFQNLYAQNCLIWGNVYWDNVKECYAVPVAKGKQVSTVLQLSGKQLPLAEVTSIANGYLARYKAA